MSDEPEGFARRWSRLKRQPAPAPSPSPVAAVAAPELPEEIPPAAETIPLEEIAGWLPRHVPEVWRQAALRRLWIADPAIRNFIGPADYAWDWNTAGGVPGWGPLRAIDDIAKLLVRAIGETPPDMPEPPPADLSVPAIPPPPAPLIAEAATALEPLEPALRRRGGGATPT